MKISQQEFATLIEEFDGDLTKLVMKYLKKIQQPSPWTFEDLKQEAIKVSWYKFLKFFDRTKSSPRTFLNMCAGNALYDIMFYSWNKPGLKFVGSFTDDEDSEEFYFISNYDRFTEEIESLLLEDVFTTQEKKYIQILVFPDLDLAKKNSEDSRRIRINARGVMGIDLDTEYNLRCAIKEKLEERIQV